MSNEPFTSVATDHLFGFTYTLTKKKWYDMTKRSTSSSGQNIETSPLARTRTDHANRKYRLHTDDIGGACSVPNVT